MKVQQYKDILLECLVTLRHARTFVTSREKMHPTGVGLYDKLVTDIEGALTAPGPEGPTQETRAGHETSIAPKVRTFERASKAWAQYPIGTIAQQSWTGCKWTKTERGWKAHAGDTFPIPGGADQVLLPESETSGEQP